MKAYGADRLRVAVLCAAFLSGIIPIAGGQDPAQMLQELEVLTTERRTQLAGEMRASLQHIQEAARTPQAAGQAFMEAHREVALAGTSRSGSAFSDWRRSNEDWLNSDEFRLAAQMHLNYLALTIQRGASDDPEEFVLPSIEYVSQFAAAERRIEEGGLGRHREVRNLIQNPINNSLFVRAWRLSPLLSRVGDWEMTPGNVEGILEKNVRSVHRVQRNPLVLDTWNWQIKYEEERLRNVQRQHERANFERVRRPALQFARARDQAAIGNPMGAAAEGLRILRAHPDHPQFDGWANQVRNWIRGVTE